MRPFLYSALTIGLATAGLASAETTVNVIDASHNPASNFLAYTEFELSGEPLAEALGLDLDILDVDALNKPTEFDYTAGIEAYEYSEEAMYALNYQSQMGPHLVNGPSNATRGGDFAALKKTYQHACRSRCFSRVRNSRQPVPYLSTLYVRHIQT